MGPKTYDMTCGAKMWGPILINIFFDFGNITKFNRDRKRYAFSCANWTVEMEEISEGEASAYTSVKTEGPCVSQYIWRMS